MVEAERVCGLAAGLAEPLERAIVYYLSVECVVYCSGSERSDAICALCI